VDIIFHLIFGFSATCKAFTVLAVYVMLKLAGIRIAYHKWECYRQRYFHIFVSATLTGSCAQIVIIFTTFVVH
jgi:hypothetical protein